VSPKHCACAVRIDGPELDGDSDFVVVEFARETAPNPTTTTRAPLPGKGKPPTAEPLTVAEPQAAELPAGAAEAIAIAEGNPELGAAVADQIRAEASAIGLELEGRWDWFVTALCVVIVARRAAKKGHRSTGVGNPVVYAMSTACRKAGSSYRAKGGPDGAGRKAEADVRRGMAARAADIARQAAAANMPRIAPTILDLPPAEEIARQRAMLKDPSQRPWARIWLAKHGLDPSEDRDG
jgi:hypothetical protein